MNIYIHEWEDSTATLVINDGESMVRYCTMDDAVEACNRWYPQHCQIIVNNNTTQDLTCSTI